MIEYVRKFRTPSEGDGYVIYDVPFITSVRKTKQNLHYGKTNPAHPYPDASKPAKRLKKVDNRLVLEDAVPADEIWYTTNGEEIQNLGGNLPSPITTSYDEKNDRYVIKCSAAITDISGVFTNCTTLKTVDLPGVRSNSANVYSNNYLTTIGTNAFKGCTSLEIIRIPNGIKRIENYAFQGCTSLTSVNIPEGVTSIGERAFAFCTGLTSVTIPNSVTTIGEYAFYKCTSLTSIEIPNSVTSIGDIAFAFCTGLTSVTIPNSVTSIGDGTFQNCTSLTSVTIGNSVTSIGDYAFYYCSGLTSIEIPNSVTSIGNFAFAHCTGLTSITCEATTPPTLGSGALDNTNNCPIYVPRGSYSDYVNPDSSISKGWYDYEDRMHLMDVAV